ncbi:uroporphyrinogen-III synthase [Persephonella sp.]
MINILITKPEEDTAKIKEAFKKDIRIIPFSTIKTVPVEFEINTENFDIFIFTSVNTVKHFFNQIDPEKLREKIIIAVGDKTKAELKKLGFDKVKVPETQSSEGVLNLLSDSSFKNKKIAFPRAKKGVDLLLKSMENITLIPVYETVINIPENTEKVRELFEKNRIDYAVFTSPSNIENFLKIFGSKGIKFLKETKVIPIGKTTGGKLKDLGIEPLFIPEKPSIKGILERVLSA